MCVLSVASKDMRIQGNIEACTISHNAKDFSD